MREVPDTEDLLGFCEDCFRVRWLKVVGTDPMSMTGNKCRQCVREAEENDRSTESV